MKGSLGFEVPTQLERDFSLLVLDSVLNEDAISYDLNRSDGDEWVLGIPYPAEELPPSKSVVWVNDIPFLFPNKEDQCLNNFFLSSQELTFAPLQANKLFLLCSGDNGDYIEQASAIDVCGTPHDFEIGFPDSLNILPSFGASVGWRCTHSHYQNNDLTLRRTLWMQAITIDTEMPICSLRFNENPFAHIFCITLQ